MADHIYLLLNKDDVPVARGRLQNASDAPQLQVRVLDGEIDETLGLSMLKLVGLSQDQPMLQGSIVRRSGDVVILQRDASGKDIRETLRVKVGFDTLIYPVDGSWCGRRKVETVDLSCGGIAFSSGESLKPGERIEIVIPVTAQPLLLKAQVLRTREGDGGVIYAAKFVDMCHDEEMMICEAVFGIQLKQHRKMK